MIVETNRNLILNFRRATSLSLGEGRGEVERCLGVPKLPSLGGPHQHVALACGQEGAPFAVGIFRCYGAELRIVVELEIHPCVLHWLPFLVQHKEIDSGT